MISYKIWKTLNESMGFNLGISQTPSIFVGGGLTEMKPTVSSILNPDISLDKSKENLGDSDLDGINPSSRDSLEDDGDNDMDDMDDMDDGDEDDNFVDIDVSLDNGDGDDDDFDDGEHAPVSPREVSFMTKNGPVKFMDKGVRKMQKKFMSKDGKSCGKMMDKGSCKPCGKMMDKDCNKEMKENSAFINMLKKQFVIPKKNSSFEEDYLITPNTPEPPRAGETGFAPSNVVGGVVGASGFTADDLAAISHLLPTMEF